MLGDPGSTVQEHQVRRARVGVGQLLAVQAIVTDRLGQRVVQRLGEQLARALHRMLSPGDRIGTAIEAAGERLARRVAIETGDRRLAHVAGQPGTLQQPLGVDHQVIVDFLQALLEAPPFAVAQGLPEVLAPAPDRHRDHPRHRRMPGGNLGETFLHHPVELDAGNRPGGVGKRRQGVDHVAEGRGLDQQYPHPATSAGSPTSRSRACNTRPGGSSRRQL